MSAHGRYCELTEVVSAVMPTNSVIDRLGGAGNTEVAQRLEAGRPWKQVSCLRLLTRRQSTGYCQHIRTSRLVQVRGQFGQRGQPARCFSGVDFGVF